MKNVLHLEHHEQESVLTSRLRAAARWGMSGLCAFALSAAGRVGAQTGQGQTPLTVLVADFIDSRVHEADKLSLQARDAVAGELASSGQAQYKLVPRAEVLATAKEMGMRLPKDALKPAEITLDDWFRLARALHADALVTGDVAIQSDKRKGDGIALTVLVRDASEGEPLNGGQGRATAAAREGELEEEAQTRGVSDAALSATRQMLQRQFVVGTVLNAHNGVVTINRGAHDGLHVGDELKTYRYGTNGVASSTGRIRVTRIYQDNAEAKILLNNGIGTEDVARKTFRPAQAKTAGQ